jgi:ribonuclease D
MTKKILYNKIDKQLVATMPRALFEGRIIVVQSEAEADKAVSYLRTFPILGFDTETRPSFKKGIVNKVALLQVSTEDTCFLFRLNNIGIPSCVTALFQDKHVLKVGLSIKDDLRLLHARENFEQHSCLDLQNYVMQFGIEDKALRKLYANVFGQKISKGQQLTNWEADVLTDGQKLYAATDAWACLKIYNELESLRVSGSYELKIMETI